MNYSAPGAPELAEQTTKLLTHAGFEIDFDLPHERDRHFPDQSPFFFNAGAS